MVLEHENHTLGALKLQNHIDKAYEKNCRRLEICSRVLYPNPNIKKNFYKFWWSQELDYLKQASINSNRLWLAAGKPRSGPIFNDRQSCRKRLRDEQRNETSSYTNALHDALIRKKGPTFWKCWRSKFTTSSRCMEVDGCTDSAVIADNFSN